MTSKEPKPDAVDAADDLDDLDDILDEFNQSDKKTASQPKDTGAATATAAVSQKDGEASSASTKEAVADAGGEETEDEINAKFARELQEGMEALMKGGVDPSTGLPKALGDLGAAEGAGANGGEGGEEELMNEEEMMRQFEKMMADMGFGAPSGTGAGAGAAAATATGASSSRSASGSQQQQQPQQPANFQDAIRNTMSRLRESDQTATSSAGQASDMDFEKLMSAFGGAEGVDGGEEGIAQMLENMMGELMSKDVLYDPLKELGAKYPDYLANPPKPLSAEDRSRYEDQNRIVKQVLAAFDDPKFDNGTDAEKQALKSQVANLMNEMQDSGAPPSEIIGDLPPELEGMPGLGDENCTIM